MHNADGAYSIGKFSTSKAEMGRTTQCLTVRKKRARQLQMITIVSFQYCDRAKQTTEIFKQRNKAILGRCGGKVYW